MPLVKKIRTSATSPGIDHSTYVEAGKPDTGIYFQNYLA
jgi:hypothetical protein